MTEKQIIIDGVDVSGCEYYFDEKCRCMDASIMQDFYSYPQCNNNPNCHYKNWKRKEQKCEELNKEIHNLNSTINFIKVTEHSAINKYNKLKQTLTEIKEHFNEECKLCKAYYVNITDEICEECKYKEIIQKCEVLDV